MAISTKLRAERRSVARFDCHANKSLFSKQFFFLSRYFLKRVVDWKPKKYYMLELKSFTFMFSCKRNFSWHVVLLNCFEFPSRSSLNPPVHCKPGMHNIRPAGQMRPAEAFYLARKVQNFVHLTCLLEKTPLNGLKNIDFLPLDMANNFFLARLRFDLGTSAVNLRPVI